MAVATAPDDEGGSAVFSVVVAAAGVGARMDSALKKPYLLLCGRPVISHTLDRLRQCRGCGEIVLVVHPEEYERPPEGGGEQLKWEHGVEKVVPGGATRQESVSAGLKLVGEEFEIVLIHDGVRPLVEAALVERTALEAARWGAAIAAVPVVETVKNTAPDGVIVETLDRENLWLAQTPQAFRKDLILRAYGQAEADGFVGTDDAQLVERLGERVRIVEDSPENVKITTPRDLVVAEEILRRQNELP
jgi:2-C-methyl-D-erythritol 4-phosphate cytidylyltransferase